MSPVTGLAWLEGQILSSVQMGNFSPVTVHMGNFRSVTKTNKVPPFKIDPSNRAKVFIWENFQASYQDLSCKNQDLSNQTSLPSHMNTSKFLQRKQWRGDNLETKPGRLTSLI